MSNSIVFEIQPYLKFKDLTVEQQITKTVSELGEVVKAWEQGSVIEASYEAMDAITTLANLMHNQLGLSVQEIEDIAYLTNKKNAARGYCEK